MITESNYLAEENIPLAKSLVKRYIGKGIEYDDLYQAACLGLTKAARNFDNSRGIKFSTYAVPVILGEIKQLFRSGGAVKVSRTLKELKLQIDKASREYTLKHSTTPKVSELAEILGESEDLISEAICSSDAVISIDESSYALNMGSIENFEDDLIDFLSLRSAIAQLTKDDLLLLRYRFFKHCTQQKTAHIMGLTQVQVSRREKKILQKLKTLIVEKEL